MILTLLALLTTVSTSPDAAFLEDNALWTEIDRINSILEDSGNMDSDVLEELFRESVEIAVSGDLSEQFESIQMYSFESGDYSLTDEYVERAAPGITIMLLGESTAFGVNTIAFLERSNPGSEAYEFFQIAIDGFYVDGDMLRIGTADLPAWMERSGSSAQASVDPDRAVQWLGIWQSLRPSLDGYFLTIADKTIQGLSSEIPVD